MGWEKGLSKTDMLIVDNFRRMQKWDYSKKFTHAMEVAKAYFDINRDEGRNVHVSVGGLDSIVLLLFLRECCDIDVPAISVSSLEDASIQRIHKQLGVKSLPSAQKEDGTGEYGWGRVLDYIGVPWEDEFIEYEQLSILDCGG